MEKISECCEVIVKLNDKTIFQAGWQDIYMEKTEKEIRITYAILNKYRDYLSGVIDGMDRQERFKN